MVHSEPGRILQTLRTGCALLVAAGMATGGLIGPAWGQAADRDRAQMLQMQQQLQRLQADNAALQKERSQLQAQAGEADKLKRESAQTSKDLAKVRGNAAASAREAAELREQMEALRAQTSAQIDQWRKALEERDVLLQTAAMEKHKNEAEITLLSARLKAQTARADLAEAKHAQAVELGGEFIDRYESDRLRLCEPITGIWKTRNELEVQKMRDRLFALRLDVPLVKSASTPAAAPGQSSQ